MQELVTGSDKLTILNTPSMQLVFGAQMLQVVAWQRITGEAMPSSVPTGFRIGVTHAAMLIVREKGHCVYITASNPDQPGVTLKVSLDRSALQGSACHNGPGGLTQVALKLPAGDYMGQSVTAKCCIS